MKMALEEELGATFSARAASLPPDALRRVRSTDYHPRQHRRSVPVGLGASAVGAATVGTVLAVLGSAAPAYAGWSAAPTSTEASTAPSPATDTSCLSRLASMQPPAGGTSPGTWQPVLTDVRGPFTVALFQAGSDDAACFTGPSFMEVNQLTSPSDGTGALSGGVLSVGSASGSGTASAGSSPATGQTAVILEGTSTGDLNQVVETNLTTTGDGPYTLVDGKVANGVTGVTLVRDDGQDVVASVADGWFVAWWPGAASAATSAQVTKPSGTTSEPLVPSSKLAAPGSCTSTSGTAHCVGSDSGGQIKTGDSGNSGNSGNIARLGNSGNTGSGSTTPSKP